MDYETRYFVLVEGKIEQIGIERLAKLYHGVAPEYAGQRIPHALLLFEREGNRLKDLRHWQAGYLVFDKKGKSDEISGQNVIELSLTSEKDPKSFVARRADQIRRERAWHPTSEELNRMIELAKAKAMALVSAEVSPDTTHLKT